MFNRFFAQIDYEALNFYTDRYIKYRYLILYFIGMRLAECILDGPEFVENFIVSVHSGSHPYAWFWQYLCPFVIVRDIYWLFEIGAENSTVYFTILPIFISM